MYYDPKFYDFGVVSNRCHDFDLFAENDNFRDYFGMYCITQKSTDHWDYTKTYGDIMVVQYEVAKNDGCSLYIYKQRDEFNPDFLEYRYNVKLPNDKDVKNWYPVFSIHHWPSGWNLELLPYEK